VRTAANGGGECGVEEAKTSREAEAEERERESKGAWAHVQELGVNPPLPPMGTHE
jgi:hypothetical protein